MHTLTVEMGMTTLSELLGCDYWINILEGNNSIAVSGFGASFTFVGQYGDGNTERTVGGILCAGWGYGFPR